MRRDPVVARYPKERARRDKSHRPWRADYDLAYDGGGSEWSGYYRTRVGAEVAIWLNLYVLSWGGSAELVQQGEVKR
jgi:hypothetical protein